MRSWVSSFRFSSVSCNLVAYCVVLIKSFLFVNKLTQKFKIGYSQISHYFLYRVSKQDKNVSREKSAQTAESLKYPENGFQDALIKAHKMAFRMLSEYQKYPEGRPFTDYNFSQLKTDHLNN